MITLKILASVMLCVASALGPTLALAAQWKELPGFTRDDRLARASIFSADTRPYRSSSSRDYALQYSQNLTAPVGSNIPSSNAISPSSEPGTLTISAELKDEIRNIILNERAEGEIPIFKIVPGASIPSSVKLHPFPPAVVEIIPTHRSYQYLVVTDRRIVIVDPSTREIAFVILP